MKNLFVLILAVVYCMAAVECAGSSNKSAEAGKRMMRAPASLNPKSDLKVEGSTSQQAPVSMARPVFPKEVKNVAKLDKIPVTSAKTAEHRGTSETRTERKARHLMKKLLKKLG